MIVYTVASKLNPTDNFQLSLTPAYEKSDPTRAEPPSPNQSIHHLTLVTLSSDASFLKYPAAFQQPHGYKSP